MNDSRRSLAGLSDDELGAQLRSLAGWVASPVQATAPGTLDPARQARLRIERGEGRPGRPWWPFGRGTWSPFGGVAARPLRRSFVLAIIALVVLAAIAGAIGFGVPGIRLFFVGATPTPGISASPPSSVSTSPSPSVSPSPSIPGPPGSNFDLGLITTPSEAPTLTGFALQLPTDPVVGPPDTVWYDQGRLTIVWASRPGLPDAQATGVGLLLTEFRGSLDREFFGKMIGPGTTVTPVAIGGVTGYWISGAMHDLVYIGVNGQIENDSRRVVGDTLIWTRGNLTFRLETTLGQDSAIRIAESIR
jgi:hypothetical protein